jgi:rhomboid protease GluP
MDDPRSEDPAETSGPTESEQQLSRAIAFSQTLHRLTPRVLITPAIVVVNVAVVVLMIFLGVHIMSPSVESLIQWGANFAPMTTGGQWWRLLTAMFLHVGLLHLAMNMWVLWDAGHLMERLIGNFGFLILYLVSGLFGSLASVWWNPQVVSAGASGAVFGVFGALLAIVVRRRRAIPMEMLARLRNGTVAFVGFNIVFGLTMPQIDMAAHMGGLVAGFIWGLLLGHEVRLEARPGRLKRNVIALVLGAALIPAAILIMPKGTARMQQELEQLEQVERACQGTYLTGLNKLRSGEISEAQMVRILRNEILPRWRETRQRLARIKDLPPLFEKHIRRLNEYMSLRQKGWELLAEGIEQKDPTKTDLALEKQREAEALLKSMESKEGQ